MLVSALPDAASLQASTSSRSAGDSWERSPEMDMEERLVAREIQDHHPERTQLTAEQAAAVLSVLTDGKRVSVINAPAGSGKTRVMTQAARAWAAAGRREGVRSGPRKYS